MLAPKQSRLITPHLSLHGIRPEDEADMVRLLTNEQVGQTYMVPEFAAPEEAVKLFNRIRLLSQDANRFVYGIYLEERLIGLLNEVDKDESSMELGYALHPDYHGNGYATEVLTAAMTELFRMGFGTVKAGAFEHNLASRRVMEKCGLTPTGKDEDITYRGQSHRCVNYAIHASSIPLGGIE